MNNVCKNCKKIVNPISFWTTKIDRIIFKFCCKQCAKEYLKK